METSLKKLFFENFRRKFLSFLAALVIWVLASSSITTTRVFPRVLVRVVNLPANKTIQGLMPDGFLDRRISVTLTGTKEVIQRLGPQDFEVVIDAADRGEHWVAKIVKSDLVSHNPDVQLMSAVTQISHSELDIQLCRLITDKVPVFVLPPNGEPPEGYQYLDIWPKHFFHIVSGPEEDVRQLQAQGLEISLDLTVITKEELESLRSQDSVDDEVSFFIPESWKKIKIPFLHNAVQTLNSPEARQLRIDFLHKNLFSFGVPIPTRIFYPVSVLEKINPKTTFLKENELIKFRENVPVVEQRLFVSSVSRLFLDIIRGHVEITIIPTIKDDVLAFSWDTQLINVRRLEEAYVALALSNEVDTEYTVEGVQAFRQYLTQRAHYLRTRFRDYMRGFTFYVSKDALFELTITRDSEGGVNVKSKSEK